MVRVTILRAAALAAPLLSGIPGAGAQTMPDLVSRTAFRVCADPAYLPFSDKRLQGFENKIADIFADELKRPVRYFWAPSGPGFIRNTLNDDLCDVVMGYTVGAEMVLSTNPYYRSTYVIVAPKGSPLNGIETMDDPRLKGHHIGMFAATTPTGVMSDKGMFDQVAIYPLIVDHRVDSPLTDLIADLGAKKIEAAIVWGPLIGDAVKHSNGALVMTPLLKDVDKPDFSFRISLGVRHDETDWKHTLEGVLRKRKADIDKVLVDYNVPLLDNSGRLVSTAQADSAHAPTIQPAADRPGHGARPAQVPKDFHMPGPAPTNQ